MVAKQIKYEYTKGTSWIAVKIRFAYCMHNGWKHLTQVCLSYLLTKLFVPYNWFFSIYISLKTIQTWISNIQNFHISIDIRVLNSQLVYNKTLCSWRVLSIHGYVFRIFVFQIEYRVCLRFNLSLMFQTYEIKKSNTYYLRSLLLHTVGSDDPYSSSPSTRHAPVRHSIHKMTLWYYSTIVRTKVEDHV